MSMSDLNQTLERTTLRRRLTRWRVLAIIAGVVALAALFWSSGDSRTRQDHIARVSISGMITNDRKQLELLETLADTPAVKAVVLDISSPGGTTAGGEVLFESIAALKAKKPVVAVQGTIATSAAYMISLPTDRIFARSSTITGSVGVIVQYPEVVEALSRIGIKIHEIKSGTLKAAPSMFQPLDDNARQLLDQMVNESKAWFIGMVKEARKIDTAQVPGLEQGAVFSGRKALEYRLIDEIGGEKQALIWLQKNKNVSEKLKVVDWRPEREGDWYGGWLSLTAENGVRSLAQAVGLGLADSVVGRGAVESLHLDGLLSVWQVH